MAIAYKLVKLMGGELKVMSIKDIGTSFFFELEFPKGKLKKLTNFNHLDNNDFHKGKKALLVEDNDLNRFIAKQSLLFMGFDVVEAENGAVAVDILKKQSFDLVLMDIQMPVMDGVEATQIIRNTLKIKIPIIAITANVFKHDIDLYLTCGMNDFITKPYDELEFARKINLIIQNEKPPAIAKKTKYDLNSLYQIAGADNKQFVDKMIGIFVQLVSENTSKLQKALVDEDYETIRKIVHKLKPSILQLNIEDLKSTLVFFESIRSEMVNEKKFIKKTLHLIDVLNQVKADLIARQ
jgi:CheY-like chemotaxis protein